MCSYMSINGYGNMKETFKIYLKTKDSILLGNSTKQQLIIGFTERCSAKNVTTQRHFRMLTSR